MLGAKCRVWRDAGAARRLGLHPMMRALLVLGLGAFGLGLAACDPVLDDGVAALGPETPPGVRPGPLHRPGQPCLLCHDGAFGDPRAFSVAGTVFQTPSSLDASVGATILLTDSTDSGPPRPPTTNAAGNFYVPAQDWTPTFPLRVVVQSAAGNRVQMWSPIGGGSEVLGGACATCHKDPAGPDSPGHVYLELDDGGVPR
jgi:hypothetical protein